MEHTRLPTVPRLPWETLQPRLRKSFKQGDHATILGPSESGKTVLAAALIELRQHVLFLVTKKRDPELSALGRRGFYVTNTLNDLAWTDKGPIHPKVLYWPRYNPHLTIAQRISAQRVDMLRALNFADRTGRWCVVVNEGIWFTQNLRLEKELNSIWFQGRTDGLGLVFEAQRPAWVPRYAYSQAHYIALFQTNDRDDLKRFSDIAAGLDVDLVRHTVANLDFDLHEFLLIDSRRREMVRSIAPAPTGART
jgi:hypothetical protein